MVYVRLTPASQLPDLAALRPYKAVVIVEETVTPARQAEISRWLIASGCVYMMAWGEDSASWEESVDHANLAAFEFGEIPDDCLVITTQHGHESLREVFWFSKHTAMHPCFPLHNIVLLHLSPDEREKEFRAAYRSA